MDKETLSNYGWIVICVLVLAVMIALATPFGTFVADGFKATYTGLFQTGDNALDVGLNAVGVSNKLPCGHGRKEAGDHSQKECGHYNCQDTDCGCVPASCGVEGHWSGDGKDHTTAVNHTGHTYACQCSGWVVPEDGKYITAGGTEYGPGDQLPCGYSSKRTGDTYQNGDYLYKASAGADYWSVSVLDKSKSSYTPILGEINGLFIESITGTFKNCTALTTAPDISACTNLKHMNNAFEGCSSLTDLGDYKIPDSVTYMDYTFKNCTALTVAPIISSKTQYMSEAFRNCTSLTTAPVIPSSVTNMTSTFQGCTSLKTYAGSTSQDGDFSGYVIPSEAYNMRATFYECESIVIAPDFSNCNKLNNMSITFAECTNLKTAPIVPASVTSLSQAFRECTNLTGTVIINASNLISTNEDAFNRVNFATQNITLAGESTILDLIGSSGQNYCAECNGTCQGNH